jgi:hypothetical protein
MPQDDVAIDEIKALEDRRYEAMLAGETIGGTNIGKLAPVPQLVSA